MYIPVNINITCNEAMPELSAVCEAQLKLPVNLLYEFMI